MTTPQIFEIVGLAGMSGALLMAILAWAARRWPTAEGRVLTSYLEVDQDSDGDRTEYSTLVYEYVVAGQTYVTSRIYPDVERAWSTPTPGLSSASMVVREYREGSRVTVFYCPLRPSYACLRPGCYGFPILLFLLCAGVFWSARVHGRDSTPPPEPVRTTFHQLPVAENVSPS